MFWGGGEAGEERGDGEGGVAEGEEGRVDAGGGGDYAAEVGEEVVGFGEVEGEPGLEGFDGGGGGLCEGRGGGRDDEFGDGDGLRDGDGREDGDGLWDGLRGAGGLFDGCGL